MGETLKQSKSVAALSGVLNVYAWEKDTSICCYLFDFSTCIIMYHV